MREAWGVVSAELGTGFRNVGPGSLARKATRLALAFTALFIIAGTIPVSAAATPSFGFEFSFGGENSGPGHLWRPHGIAVDAEGNVWVVDSAHNRVQVFSAKGEFIRQFGSYGTANGQFSEPRGIAIDSKGNVWVADNHNDRIEEFDKKGQFIRKIGSHGTANGQFWSPSGIAVDSKDNLWVADTLNNRIQEFNWGGGFIQKFGSKGSGNGAFNSPDAVPCRTAASLLSTAASAASRHRANSSTSRKSSMGR